MTTFALILLIAGSFVGGFMTRHMVNLVENRVQPRWYNWVWFVGSSLVAAAAVALLYLAGGG